jgi:hypothetical protein
MEIGFANSLSNPIGFETEISTPAFGGLASMGIGF